MENFEEKSCLCALNRIFGFKPKTALALISHLGSASGVFRLSKDEKECLLGPHSGYVEMLNWKSAEDASKELMKLSDKGIVFSGITEESYPELLKECEDPPVGLYVRGITPLDKLWNKESVAVVGTRDISPYGRDWCARIVKGLAATGTRPPIVSGLALGVDIEAHKTAIENGLPTIAVMATGPDSIYPQRHKAYAERIASTPGCALITDYPPGTAPLAIHFLRRNRIIAGLSKATLLIESKLKGGGLMTCRLAFSYNREVYALPGRADDIRSQGCNELIRKKMAEPITSVSSLTDSLGMVRTIRSTKTDFTALIHGFYRGQCSEEDIALLHKTLSAIEKNRGATVEEIGDILHTGYLKASELIGLLEIDGFITVDLLQRCSINSKNM